MTDSFQIRPARKADASDIALLVNIATHGAIGRGWAQDQRISDTYDPLEVGRLDMLDDSEDLNWRNASMAEHDGEVVGMLLGYPKSEQSQPLPPDLDDFLVPILELEESATGQWFISMLGVFSPWRSKGIGKLFLDLAESKRRETGRRGLALIVEDGNERACQLYEREGFSVSATRPMRAYPGGNRPGQNWLLMVKE